MSHKKTFIPFGQESFTREELSKYLQQERELGVESGIKTSWAEFRDMEQSKKKAHSELVKRDIKNICEDIKYNLSVINEKNIHLSNLTQGAAKVRRKKEVNLRHDENQKMWLVLYDKCQLPDQLEILDAVLTIFKHSSRNSKKPKSPEGQNNL